MDAIIGQPHALDVLRSALRSGRMHHAWIFHGPLGVGKATTALAVARALLCHEPATDEAGNVTACGRCRSCTLLASEQAAHPDLHVVRKELAQYSDDPNVRSRKLLNIPLAVVEEHLILPAHQSASLRHNKVFIVDEAELLAWEGQNKMLKTLEEPPPGTFIFLITANEDRLLPTIRSRCQRVPFGSLEESDVAAWLERQPQAASLSAEQRAWMANFARGSLGRAGLAMTYRLDRWADRLEPLLRQVVNGQSTPELGPTMAELVDAFAKAWVDANTGASKDAANKAGVRHLFNLISERCRTGIRQRLEAGQQGAEADRDPEAIEASVQPLLRGIELVREAERDLDSNVALALLLDNLAIQWATDSEPYAGAAR